MCSQGLNQTHSGEGYFMIDQDHNICMDWLVSIYVAIMYLASVA